MNLALTKYSYLGIQGNSVPYALRITQTTDLTVEDNEG